MTGQRGGNTPRRRYAKQKTRDKGDKEKREREDVYYGKKCGWGTASIAYGTTIPHVLEHCKGKCYLFITFGILHNFALLSLCNFNSCEVIT
jgi:hypothetical protein